MFCVLASYSHARLRGAGCSKTEHCACTWNFHTHTHRCTLIHDSCQLAENFLQLPGRGTKRRRETAQVSQQKTTKINRTYLARLFLIWYLCSQWGVHKNPVGRSLERQEDAALSSLPASLLLQWVYIPLCHRGWTQNDAINLFHGRYLHQT